MSDRPTPAGWYEDPYGEGTWRWWDGSSWSTATRLDGRATGVPVAASAAATSKGAASATSTEQMFAPDRRDRRRATLGLGALALIAAAIVGSAILFTGNRDDLAVDEVPGANDPPPTSAGSEETSPDEALDSDAGTPSDATDDTLEDEGAEPSDTDDEPEENGSIELDFDGVCTVEVDADDVDDPRPWHFDECTSAPIELSDGDGRWVVVIASLSEDSYDEAAARERAAEEGFDDNLLWSSHYPSLNPGLWVVFDGPFGDQEEARSAAAEIGGGSYPRLLSDDDDDRYCVAADGCVGDQGDS